MDDDLQYSMNSHLEGLLLPSDVPTVNEWLIYSGILLVFLLGCGAIVWRHFSLQPHRLALKKINHLAKISTLSPQEQSLSLVKYLCEGLMILRLDQYQPSQKKAWISYVQRLDVACYSSCSDIPMTHLINEAKQWIRHAK